MRWIELDIDLLFLYGLYSSEMGFVAAKSIGRNLIIIVAMHLAQGLRCGEDDLTNCIYSNLKK